MRREKEDRSLSGDVKRRIRQEEGNRSKTDTGIKRKERKNYSEGTRQKESEI